MTMDYERTVTIRNRIIGGAYRRVLKPLFFARDPERVHDLMTATGACMGRHAATRRLARVLFSYAHPSLEQTMFGLRFVNPIGLAAGFDKNAELTDILPDVGFGFAEIGSVTGEPCEGNPKPRLWRLPASQSLLVYYGLKNDGCEAIAARLTGRRFRIPVGISVAKTNSPATVETAAGIADYVKAFRTVHDVAGYVTVNISCPNAFGGEPFTDPGKLDLLLAAIDRLAPTKPVFLKLPADLAPGELDALLDVSTSHRVDGYICSNLTKRRENPRVIERDVPTKGGLSGKPTELLANALISHCYRRLHGRAVIVGCGGVFTAEDAYEKIRLGASLIQMITGMIYRGPQVVSEINQGLVRLLKRDGYTNVSQAVGAAHR